MKKKKDLLPAIGFLAPNFFGFILFTAGPVLVSLVLSFTNWNLMRTVPFEWVWFRNFSELINDDKFWLYFINTAYFMIGMPISIAGSLFLAILLTRKIHFVATYRTLYYLPQFTAGVALMILWKALYNPEFGIINASIEWVFSHLGISADPPLWLLSTKNIFALALENVGFSVGEWGVGAKDAIIIMGLWTAIGGGNMLLYIAAISAVPQELYEAADIDGASPWQRFRYVVWPQLAPTTFFIFIMSFIGGLQGGFEQARVMTGGGPSGSTTTLSYYIYIKAFEEYQLGYASAVSWVLFIIIFAVTILNWKFGSSKMEDAK